LAGVRAGQRRAVARAISLVEDGGALPHEVRAALAAHPPTAHVVGLTGPPGVGKSTSVAALVGEYRRRGVRVGVLAVDPSSPLSSGALLGDRVRMTEHETDPEVFIRSLAARGHLGGLARSVPHALRVLDLASCAVVLIETVGVGQSETEVTGFADSTVVLVAPGAGDAVQAAKAGLAEVGDVYVVNKADQDGAPRAAAELRGVLAASVGRPDGWQPPVLTASAVRGEGLAEVVDALDAHHAWLREHGGLAARRRRRIAVEIEAIALAALRERVGEAALDDLAGAVLDGRLDPESAAKQLLAGTGRRRADGVS
jgi:LAO/AO transport system kinase